jgi:hypothetical protein
MAKYLITESQSQVLEENYPRHIVYEDIDDDDEETEIVPDVPQEPEEQPTLRFSKTGNAKIAYPSFSLPAGYTCPFAKACKATADPVTGKLTDCAEQQFRCFSASQEGLLPTVRKMRWHNYNLLKQKETVEQLAELIERSFHKYFPDGVPVLRLHVGGDFYSNAYFAAWMQVAKKFPQTHFYAYTKSIPFWVRHKDEIPSNMMLNASMGGTHDELAKEHGFKTAEVVFSPETADAMGKKIDHDDALAAFGKENFALLLHGQQRKGSEASVAQQKLRKSGLRGYGKTIRVGKKKPPENPALTEELKRMKLLI